MANPWNDEKLDELYAKYKEGLRTTWRHVNRDLTEEELRENRRKCDEIADAGKARLAELLAERPLSIVSVHDCEHETDPDDMEGALGDSFESVPEGVTPFFCSLGIWLVFAFEGEDKFLNDDHFGFDEVPSEVIKSMTEREGFGTFETLGPCSGIDEAMFELEGLDFWESGC